MRVPLAGARHGCRTKAKERVFGGLVEVRTASGAPTEELFDEVLRNTASHHDQLAFDQVRAAEQPSSPRYAPGPNPAAPGFLTTPPRGHAHVPRPGRGT
ncbi:hypothetical protein [Streptomyces sp. NPDC048611]|uniref:hypothetical protein n=1 Tax=Streptomyces sp. NPDC048611 TaxID=3155635 RepID=UPI003431DA68